MNLERAGLNICRTPRGVDVRVDGIKTDRKWEIIQQAKIRLRMEKWRIGSCGQVLGISGAGGGDRAERISGYGREGNGDDSRRDLDERKIEFVDGGKGNSNGVRRGGGARIDSVRKWGFGDFF